MTTSQRALLKALLAAQGQPVHVALLSCTTVMLRNVSLDEQSGILTGENLGSWPDMKLPSEAGEPRPAKTFTCRAELVAGFWVA